MSNESYPFSVEITEDECFYLQEIIRNRLTELLSVRENRGLPVTKEEFVLDEFYAKIS